MSINIDDNIDKIILQEDEAFCWGCEEPQKKKNIARHRAGCDYCTDIKRPKSEILQLLKENPNESFRCNKIVKLELENTEVKLAIKSVYHKFKGLYDKYILNEDDSSPEDKINTLNLSQSTKENYQREWRLFRKWIDANDKPVSVVSLNLYLTSLTCLTTTKFNKRGILQNIMRLVLDKNVKLNPMRQRMSFKPKYSMTRSDIINYLDEQRKLNFENYIIQKIMITCTLRVGPVAGFKRKHFDFYNLMNDSSIAVRDNKGRLILFKKLEEEFKNEITKYLDGREDYANLGPEDYVFYRSGAHYTLKRRSRDLSARINELIKKSKVFTHSPNYKFSSHILRKALPNLLYTEKMEEAKKDARELLGHKRGTNSVNHYIDNVLNL